MIQDGWKKNNGMKTFNSWNWDEVYSCFQFVIIAFDKLKSSPQINHLHDLYKHGKTTCHTVIAHQGTTCTCIFPVYTIDVLGIESWNVTVSKQIVHFLTDPQNTTNNKNPLYTAWNASRYIYICVTGTISCTCIGSYCNHNERDVIAPYLVIKIKMFWQKKQTLALSGYCFGNICL